MDDTPTRWTEQEKEIFLEALDKYKKDFNVYVSGHFSLSPSDDTPLQAIADCVRTKTSLQCRNFYNNYRKKLHLDDIVEQGGVGLSFLFLEPSTFFMFGWLTCWQSGSTGRGRGMVSYWTQQEKEDFLKYFQVRYVTITDIRIRVHVHVQVRLLLFSLTMAADIRAELEATRGAHHDEEPEPDQELLPELQDQAQPRGPREGPRTWQERCLASPRTCDRSCTRPTTCRVPNRLGRAQAPQARRVLERGFHHQLLGLRADQASHHRRGLPSNFCFIPTELTYNIYNFFFLSFLL